MISVRVATEADLPGIVAVHRDAFDGFFMTRLGPRFLREYYRTVCEFASGIALVATSAPDRCAGFAVGFVNPQAFYRQLRARRLCLLMAALPALFRSPSLWPRMRGNSRRVAAASREDFSHWTSELSSIGVIPAAQGQGIGRKLVAAFLEHSERMGARQVSLTTDALDNHTVNQFYQSLGFQIVDTIGAPGQRQMHSYLFRLDDHRRRAAA